MKIKKTNLMMVLIALVFGNAVSAMNIECFENEADTMAVHLFISFVDNSQTVINFQEIYSTPHPEKKVGF